MKTLPKIKQKPQITFHASPMFQFVVKHPSPFFLLLTLEEFLQKIANTDRELAPFPVPHIQDHRQQSIVKVTNILHQARHQPRNWKNYLP